VIDALRQEFARGMAQLEGMKGEVALARVAAGQSASSSSAPLPAGCRAVPPANFAGGRRDSESIESWLFSVEQYFDLTGLPDGLRRVQYAGSLLRGPALVWFRTMCSTQGHLAFISTWVLFCRELRANFCPTNLTKLARDRLAYLRQTGSSVRDYVRDFRAVCLEIPLLSADERLDRFTRGLKPHIRREVELREPTTFEEAVRLAEKFDSAQRSVFPSSNSSSSSSSGGRALGPRRYEQSYNGPAPMDLNAIQRSPRHQQGGLRSAPGRSPSPSRPRLGRGGLTPEEKAKLTAEGRCFYCKETGHMLDSCPKRLSQGNGRRPPTPGPRR